MIVQNLNKAWHLSKSEINRNNLIVQVLKRSLFMRHQRKGNVGLKNQIWKNNRIEEPVMFRRQWLEVGGRSEYM